LHPIAAALHSQLIDHAGFRPKKITLHPLNHFNAQQAHSTLERAGGQVAEE
jgi:hypothetical protein